VVDSSLKVFKKYSRKFLREEEIKMAASTTVRW